MSTAPNAAAPETSAYPWESDRSPEFWSIVSHAGIVYARTEAGLMWWDDGNRLWTSVKQNPFDVYCMGLAAGADATRPLYALEGHFLFVSYDGGRAWERRALPMTFALNSPPTLAADPFARFTVYLYAEVPVAAAPSGQERYALYWSFDAGRTWDGPLTAGAPGKSLAPGTHGFLAVPADPGRYGSGGLFMSTGRGVYWWFGLPFPGAGADALMELPESDPGTIAAMAVGSRANNPVALAIFTASEKPDTRVQVSLDGGKSWTVRNPYAHPFWIDDLLYVDDLLFVKLVHWDPAQGDKNLGAILMSRDDGKSYIDVTAPDMVAPLTAQMASSMPRQGLAASPTHLYVMSRGMGARAIAFTALR